MTQFNKGDKVWIHSIRKRGEILDTKGENYLVEYSIKVNGKLKTIREQFELSEIAIYKPKPYNPNEMFWMVHEFHKAFGHPISDKPTPLNINTAINRAVWTGEEVVENLYATVEGNEVEFKEMYEIFKLGLDKAFNKMLIEKKPVTNKVVAQADALTDQMYFILGSFVQMGIQPFNLFKIVQEANMGKLHDGKPKYRDSDGKIMKPDNWERDFAPEPKLTAEIKRQSRI